jgi:hypothetical protein
MFFIHIGFCMYEVGASRTKNMMHTRLAGSVFLAFCQPMQRLALVRSTAQFAPRVGRY